MPLLHRIATVLGLWLLAGVACAIFSDVTLEAGEHEAMARLQIVFLTPLLAAIGISTSLVRDQQHYFYLSVVSWFVMTTFVAHAIGALTRRDRRQFMAWVAVQILILGVSVCCTVSFSRSLAEAGP